MREAEIDTTGQRVTVRTPRGNLYVGPAGRIDGLWRIAERELRTAYAVRAMTGGVTRHTILAWRRREQDPFPGPVVTLAAGDGKAKLELWSRTEVEAWLARREAAIRDKEQEL